MKLDVYQVDAFTDRVFGGNPAVVCPLKSWLTDEMMQNIAMENAVAETAFIVPNKHGFDIRWFTPEIEMDLCGHATLAAAHVISKHFKYPNSVIHFDSKSGSLAVEVNGAMLTLNFPSRPPECSVAPDSILSALNFKPVAVLKSRDYVLVFQSEDDIRNLEVNKAIFDQINIDPGGVVVTAKGRDVDFVSRFFTPQASILEDPVTGSAHCSLIPYWAEVLGKDELSALQLSSRGGELLCKLEGDRVKISGRAVTFMEGTIKV